jgi:hypothetical protein
VVNQTTAIKSGDINGDGHTDVLYSHNNGEWLLMVAGDGLGGFARAATLSGAGADLYRDFELSDLDNDGDSDIVTGHYYDGSVLWLENDGAGNFSSPHIIAITFPWVGYVCVADLDKRRLAGRDGDLQHP